MGECFKDYWCDDDKNGNELWFTSVSDSVGVSVVHNWEEVILSIVCKNRAFRIESEFNKGEERESANVRAFFQGDQMITKNKF